MSRSSSPTSPAVPGGFSIKETIAGTRGSAVEAGSSRVASDTATSSHQWARTNDSYLQQQPPRGALPRRGSDDPRVDDRIKSRAVNDLGWNWEVERAKMESGGMSGSSSMLRGTSEGGSSSAVPSSGATGGNRSFLKHLESNTIRPEQTLSPSSTNGDSPRGIVSPRTSSRSTPQPPPIDTNRNNITKTNANRSHPGQQEAAQPLSSTADTFSSDVMSQGTSSQRQQHRTPQTQLSSSSSKEKRRDQTCDACGKPMTGQFVRALGVVFHLDCFRCRDCNTIVAAKFFPATDEMSSSPVGSSGSQEGSKHTSPITTGSTKLFPLCETDYFRRLDLICASCGGALRGSYITALGKKFHVEHFTCSVCPTVFGPQDSYYEHDQRVFCHFHYSTRFAIRCTGCQTAILKQFVEINRNNQDEHWHPECYMIHKFWNIKLCPTGSFTPRESVASEPTTVPSAPEPSNTGVAPVSNISASQAPSAETLETEAKETPSSLKQKQKQMEEQVYRIWTVLSAFEESSAACISEMLRHVSNGRYLGGVRMAERFILHVEILFSAIDDIERAFKVQQVKGISHIREARMLCKKVVNFFSLLSHTQETGAQRMGITQELLSLVTGLAHYLKILIRIALTGALKLDRDYSDHEAIVVFLDKLARLARDPNSTGDDVSPVSPTLGASELHAKESTSSSSASHEEVYGYQSLPRSTSLAQVEKGEGATDLCVSCGQTVEEECTRMGVNMRWHTTCLKCTNCRRPAFKEPSSSKKNPAVPAILDTNTPPSLPAEQFALDVVRRPPFNGTSNRYQQSQSSSYLPYCPDCKTITCRSGFENVTRLEQYAFLLRVALNRLYSLLKKRGVVPASPPATSTSTSARTVTPPAVPDTIESEEKTGEDLTRDVYRDSQDIKRMKSVNLDRKLSTKAMVPHISTVVGSPSGRMTQTQKATTSSLDQRIRDTPSPIKASPSDRNNEGHFGRGTLLRQNSGEDSLANPNRAFSQAYQQQSTLPSESGLIQYHGTQQGPIVPIRPAFARHNTDVQIQDQGPMRQASGDDEASQRRRSETDEGLTLADIPQLLEAEQAREQHRALPSTEGRSLSELSALELFIVKHMAVMMLHQSPLKEFVPFDELIEFIESRKNTFWGKLFKGGKDKKKVEKKGIFGIPLEILVERSGTDTTLGASATHLRIPSFIDDLISSMKQMDVSIEGIFRKNGNIRRLKELSEALDRDAASVNLSDDNPVQLAALLKKWLRELPDPLLTFKLHRLFVMSQKLEPDNERNRCLHMIIVLLPKAHRDTMEVLFVFLKWVASFSHIDEETGSKMDLQNLATVLGPNILYSKGTDPAKDELFLANRAIAALLEHQDDFWLIPQEMEDVLQDRELLNSSNEMTSRDILRRCEKHAKRVRSNTLPTSKSGYQDQQQQSHYHYQNHGGNGRWQEGPANRHLPDMHGPVTVRQVYGGADSPQSSYMFKNGGSNNVGMRQYQSSPHIPNSNSVRPSTTSDGLASSSQQQQSYHNQQSQPSAY